MNIPKYNVVNDSELTDFSYLRKIDKIINLNHFNLNLQNNHSYYLNFIKKNKHISYNTELIDNNTTLCYIEGYNSKFNFPYRSTNIFLYDNIDKFLKIKLDYNNNSLNLLIFINNNILFNIPDLIIKSQQQYPVLINDTDVYYDIIKNLHNFIIEMINHKNFYSDEYDEYDDYYDTIKDFPNNEILLEDFNSINNNNINIDIEFSKNYKRDLYKYQENNVKNMIYKEWLVDNDKLILKYNKTNKNIFYYKLPDYNDIENNNFLLFEIHKYQGLRTILDNNIFTQKYINIQGGILCDEIGLGKTFTMLSLITEQLNNNENTTLIITPKRLCYQWEDEIKKSYDLKYLVISSIIHFKKLTKENIKNIDVIIISYNFLINRNYKDYVNKNQYNPILFNNFLWNRIILDEAHEYLKCTKSTKIMDKIDTNIVKIKNELYQLKAKYKWICSATPFTSLNDLGCLIDFIKTNNNIDEYNNLYYLKKNNYISKFHKPILEQIIIKNKKEEIKEQIDIPKPKIITNFIDFTDIEKAIYDSALNNKKKQFEFCNSIFINSEHIKILGNKLMDLEEVKTKMIEFYKIKLEKIQKTINNFIIKLEILENKDLEINHSSKKDEDGKIEYQKNKDELNNKIYKYKKTQTDLESKYNIFCNIEQKIQETESCPICLEELNDSVDKTILECGHIYCVSCINKIIKLKQSHNCALCRNIFDKNNLKIFNTTKIVEKNKEITSKYGSKINTLLKFLEKTLENSENRIIIYSQFDKFLDMIQNILFKKNISSINLKGNIYSVQNKIELFKTSTEHRILLLSLETANSGLNLVETSHIILLDTFNSFDKKKSQYITKQAIGRAVRLGQTKAVQVNYFLVRNSIEHEYYLKNMIDLKI